MDQWKHHAETFDKLIRGAIEKILGTPLSDTAYTQACLTPKLGGLGLRKVTEHAQYALCASWHEARVTAKENWWDKPREFGDYDTQSSASFKHDEKVHAQLVEDFKEAGSKREAQRVERCAQPHTNNFATAVPSNDDTAKARRYGRSYFARWCNTASESLSSREEIDFVLCMQQKI